MLPVSRPGNGTNPTGSVGNSTAEQKLYFWFFPSQNPDATDEIMIWLNGGVSAPLISDLIDASSRPAESPYGAGTWKGLTLDV